MINKGYLLGDRYRILDTLGEGGMANVYLAEDIILQRKVAVKILRLDLQKEPQTLARFQREALATSELSHPNIVMVLDVGTDHGLPYMVMEYVDGPDLKDYILQNSPLNLHDVVRIMDQILSAMTLAHKHNVIHRDLKPQNILMDQHGNIKIADFGIAVALNQNSITQTNSALGSVHYMSPEQTRGGLITKQSDIYSLGIILYELITGSVPFNGDSAVAIALKHAQEPIPSIKEKDEQVPQPLENVVLKATAKDPRDRYSSALEMQSDLDSSLDPGRANEAVFKPSHGINNDETIILSNFTAPKKPDSSEQKEIDESRKNDEKPKKINFFQALRNHKWWWLFVGLAAILVVVLMFLVVTNNNQSEIKIPDVVNLSEDKARQQIENVGLKVGRVKHKNSNSITRGKVIKTYPAAGKTLKKGRFVDIYVSDGAGMVRVPDVTGDSYEKAVYQLEKMGFDVVRENQFSDNVPVDHVISQSIAADVEVKPSQTSITLTVSRGRDDHHDRRKNVKLPNFKRYSLKEVQEFAHKHDLILQVTPSYSEKVKKGMIISMSPSAGTEVPRGSTIVVSVSEGPKAEKDSTLIKTFTVTYEDNDDEASDKRGNHVQIYISDDNHSSSNIYRDLYIKRDANFSIPFQLKNRSGELRVVRDGQTILNEKVNK